MSEWKTIGEIAEIYDGPHATPKKIENGYYFLSISSLLNGKLDLSKSSKICEEDYKKWTKRIVPIEGDLLFSYETRLGEAALMPANLQACLGRRMGLLRPNLNFVRSDFLLFAWLSPEFQKVIKQNTITGATVERIALSELSDFPILLPSLLEQEKIVKILTKLDQKIALNNQINVELEAMAKTLYDYWFVQFDFPDENGKPYKFSGGKMVYNDQLKREIPEGWGVKRLGEICNPTSGYPFASNTYVQDGKFKIYTIKNVQDNGILPITDNTLDTLPANLPEKCILGPGDMLMSLTGNVGRVGIVFEDNALLNQRVLKIESKYKAFIFQFLKDPRTRSLLENTATGTSQKNLSPKDVMDISIIFPGFNVLIEFEQISNEILLQITSNNQQNQELTQLRDWLLPMLMNGQVRVEDKTWKL